MQSRSSGRKSGVATSEAVIESLLAWLTTRDAG